LCSTTNYRSEELPPFLFNRHFNPDSNVIADIDVTIEQEHKTTRQGNALKLDETCVMITRDELPLVSNATVNIKTSEVDTHSTRLSFFLVHSVKIVLISFLYCY
jgi:hypothetical protein